MQCLLKIGDDSKITRVTEEIIKRHQEDAASNEFEKTVSDNTKKTVNNVLCYKVNVFQGKSSNNQDDSPKELDDETYIQMFESILKLECETKQDYSKAVSQYALFYKSMTPYLEDGERRIIRVEKKDSSEAEETAKLLTAAYGNILYIAVSKQEPNVLNIIVRKPVDMSGRKQELTLNRLQELSQIKKQYKFTEIRYNEGPQKGQTEWRRLEYGEPAPEGTEKTGRVKYDYAGREIISASVTKSSDQAYPVMSSPAGNAFDVVGRQFFNQNSPLYANGPLDLDGHNSDLYLQDFINKYLKGMYTLQGLKNLLKDFTRLKEEMLKKEGWQDSIFFTDKIDLFGQTEDGNWTLGNPDLLVVHQDGSITVVDFKTMEMTKKVLNDNYNSPLYKDEYGRERKYGDQTTDYINILAYSYGFNVEKQGYVVLADVWYVGSDKGDATEGKRYYRVTKNGVYVNPEGYTGNPENSQMIPMSKFLEERESVEGDERMRIFTANGEPVLYIEPRLHVSIKEEEGRKYFSEELQALRSGDDVPFNETLPTFSNEFEDLAKSDKLDLYDFAGAVQVRERGQGVVKYPESRIDSRSDIIGPEEIQYLAEEMALAISDDIDALENGNSRFFKDKANMAKGRSHRDIIRIIGLDNLVDNRFNLLFTYNPNFPELTKEDFKDGYYEDDNDYFDSWEDYLNAKKKNTKKQWMSNHRSQFIERMSPRLMALENCIAPRTLKGTSRDALTDTAPTVSIETSPDAIGYDTGDNESNEAFFDTYLEGLSSREKWTMQLRNFSPKLSLAQEIRRLFEKKYQYDENGKPVKDPYGYGINLRLNSTAAIQAVFDRTWKCETWEEMREQLEDMAVNPKNGWVRDLLKDLEGDDAKHENLRAKFFQNFRRDSLIYTRSRTRLNKTTGEREVITQVINMKTAQEAMIQELGADFKAGNVGNVEINGKNYSLLSAGSDDKMQINRTIQSELLKLSKNLETRLRIIYDSNKKKSQGQDSEEILKRLKDSLLSEGIIKDLTRLINGYGFEISENIVKDYCFANLGKGPIGSNAGTLLTAITKVNYALDTANNSKDKIPMGLNGNGAYGAYKDLAELLASYVQENIEASSYLDGKMYYSFVNPSRLGHIVKNLQDALEDPAKFEKYISENYGRYEGWFHDATDKNEWLNHWLYLFVKDKDAENNRKILQHSVELNYVGTEYEDLGALGFQLSILHNYFPRGGENANVRRFALPTMSNKETNEYLRMLTIGKMQEDYDINGNLSGRVNNDIIDKVLMKTFRQEINRIADVLYQFKNGNMFTENMDIDEAELAKAGWSTSRIEGLKNRIDRREITGEDIIALQHFNSGAKFHFLWYLNAALQEDQNLADDIAAMLNVKLTPKEDQNPQAIEKINTTLSAVRLTIKNRMKDIVRDEIQRMRSIGLFEKKTIKLSKTEQKEVLKYQEEFGGNLGLGKGSIEDAEEEMTKALEDFIWQDIAANINIIQLTGGDLAFYGNSINYQKRIAMMHSPGLHMMHNDKYDDGYLRSVHISDYKMLFSELLLNAEIALDRNADNIPTESRKDYITMTNIVKSKLRKINTTDGQSLTSITAMKKKLKMQGLWTDDMDKALNKILSGNYTAKDLVVFTDAPQKPFVASDMAKYSGSPSMTLRKTPLQDKNSEYLIILAEALTRKEGSKMTAIFDFMEQTAKDNPKAGIDTVHFHSVGKVGVSGVIDIASFDEDFNARMKRGEVTMSDYNSELTEFLLKHVRRADSNKESIQNAQNMSNQDGLNTLNRHERLYNSKYVDTIPVDDYIIQQTVPAHFLEEDRMLYGSQARILGISDISDGTVFDVNGESLTKDILIDEFKNLHAANIEFAFDNIMAEFGLSDYIKMIHDNPGNIDFNLSAITALNDVNKRDVVYKSLEDLLQRELAKDSRYGQDLKDSCSLVYDSTGHVIDFTVPLFEPTQSNRVQMLINSIIKSEINKQRVNGGPVVQATAYDSRLHVRFKDKSGNPLMTLDEFAKTQGQEDNLVGLRSYKESDPLIVKYKEYLNKNQAGIAYYECYAPVPDKALEKLITKEDGSYMTPKEIEDLMPEVWKSMSQMIGYRIPTEDKYSMIPMKIVGFVPKFAGEVLMLPQEITALTGSDFDIDKIYIMRKSFDLVLPEVDSFSGIIDSGIVESEISKFKNEGGHVFSGMRQAAETVMRNLVAMANGDNTRDLLSGINGEERTKIKPFAEWFKKDWLKDAFAEYSIKDSSLNMFDKKRARDNRLMDLQWAVLTNEDTVSKMLNPGNFESLKVLDRIVRIKKNSKEESPSLEQLEKVDNLDELEEFLESADPHNVTLPSSKIYFQGQNMQGAQMVGIFANNNVSHAFCSFREFKIDLDKKRNNQRSFHFNGQIIGNGNNPTQIDKLQGFNGQLISKTIARFLAAALDTAKEPCLSGINVNTFTAGVAMTLARMGFDEKAIGLFLAQPILVNLSQLYFTRRTEGLYDGQYTIKEMLNLLGIEKEEGKDPLLNLETISKKDIFTNIELFSHLTDNVSIEAAEKKEIDPNELEYQLNVLRAFNILYDISRDMQNLTFCTKYNSITNAVGPTIADTIEDTLKTEDFIRGLKNTCFYEPTDPKSNSNVATIIENDPILNAFYKFTHGETGASTIIFKNFFPHFFPGFQNVLDTFKNEYVKNGKITAKQYNQLLSEYLYYLLTYKDDNHDPVIPVEHEDLKDLIRELPKKFEHAKRIKGRKFNLILDSEIGSNGLRVRKADNFLAIDSLLFSGSQLDAEQKDRLRVAWNELLTSDNDELVQLGVDLFFYFIMRNGFTFSPKTMMHLATALTKYNATYKKGFDNYINGLMKLKDVDALLTGGALNDNLHVRRFLSQFMRNHAGNKNMVPNLSFTDPIISPDIEDGKEVGLYIEVPEKENYKLKKIMLSENSPAQFITVTKKLGSTLFQTLYELDRSESEKQDIDGNITLKYVRTNRLGLVNNFIEYNANSDINDSFFEGLRTESSDSYSEEEDYSYDKNKDNGEYDTSLQYTNDSVMEGSIETKIKSILQNNLIKGQENKKLRTGINKIISAIVESGENESTLKKAFDDLLNFDGSEENKLSAYSNLHTIIKESSVEVQDVDKESILTKIEEQIKKIEESQNKCN